MSAPASHCGHLTASLPEVLPFGPAALLERFAKGAKHRRERRHRPDHGYAPNPTSLLRPRRERPRRPAAQKRDEVVPLHCLMLPVLSTERIAHLATAQGRCAAAFQSSLCRRWGHSRPIDTAIAVAAVASPPEATKLL